MSRRRWVAVVLVAQLVTAAVGGVLPAVAAAAHATVLRSYTFDQSNEGFADSSSTAAGYSGGGLAITSGYDHRKPGGVSLFLADNKQYRITALGKGATCRVIPARWNYLDASFLALHPPSGYASIENTQAIWRSYTYVMTSPVAPSGQPFTLRLQMNAGCVYDNIKIEDVTGDGLVDGYAPGDAGAGGASGGTGGTGGTGGGSAPPVGGVGSGGTELDQAASGSAVGKTIYNKTYTNDPDSDLSTAGGCAPAGPLSGDIGKPLLCLLAIDQCEKPLVSLDVPGWLSYVWCELRQLPRHFLNGLLTIANVVIDLLIPAPVFGSELVAELSTGEAVGGSVIGFTAGASSVSDPGAITLFGQTGSVNIFGVLTTFMQPIRPLLGLIVYGWLAMFGWGTFRRRVLQQEEDIAWASAMGADE